MEEDSNEIRIYRILALGEVLEKIQPIIKAFMYAKRGLSTGGRENSMAFAILERINYNSQGCVSSAIELRYNHHAILPLSHIFRAMIHEVITAYWLFNGDFYNKISSLNSEFIVRNDKKIRGFSAAPDEEYMQRIYGGWADIAPENFEVIGDKLRLRTQKEINFTQFTSIAESIINQDKDLNMLYLGYVMLSQQAHISEFSRKIIYDKQGSKITLFHLACRPILAACIMLVNKIGDAADTIESLQALKDEYYPDKPQEEIP
jgi:hypothetical protein